MAEALAKTQPSERALRWAEAFLLFAAFVFFVLHFVHLTADFPNHSSWMDWSKYTDEGWYGDAAIRFFQRGRWYVPGDFNPAAALPVWPLLEAVVFRVAGVSLVAARALTVVVFGGILIAVYFLLRRWCPDRTLLGSPEQLSLFRAEIPLRLSETDVPPGRQNRGRLVKEQTLAPAIAILLLAVNPFCYVFTRLAILEPLLIFLMLLALHAASRAYVSHPDADRPARVAPCILPTLSLGLLLPAMVLTKTTAVFLFPAIAFLLWACAGYSFRLFLRVAFPVGIIAAVLWSTYFFLLVRPHFLLDYRYLFSANAYTGITAATAMRVIRDTLLDGAWIGKILFPASLVCVIWAIARPARLARKPLTGALILWAFGYAAFLAYHDNLQPRYYLVPAVPLTLLVAIVCEPALRRFHKAWPATYSTPARPFLATAVVVLLALILIMDAGQTLDIAIHPEYTLVHAAKGVAQVIRSDPSRSPLLLSISGSDLSLITGIPSICDDFGTLELPDRVKKYRPGWYAAWNQIEDDKMDALTPLYHPVRVAAFPALDDPGRNLLILYRLDPTTPTRKQRSRRQPIPRTLQTKIGQQPSETQLLH